MANDALLSALQTAVKKLPKELQKSDFADAAAKLEKTLKAAGESYAKDLDAVLKAISKDKKAAGKDKAALQQLESVEKLAKADEKERMSQIDKSGSPV